MKVAALLFLLALSPPVSAQVFRCGEPKGIAMWSNESHKPTTDGFSGVNPVVIVDAKEMTIVWGDSKSAGGAEKVWKAVIISKGVNSVSAVDIDVGVSGSVAMLYTVDMKRGFLYMSSHKEGDILNASSASSFVSACKKSSAQ